LLTILLALAIQAPALSAQLAVGLGVTLPSGDWGRTNNPGPMLALGYSPWTSPDRAARLWLQGYYGSNPADDVHTSRTKTLMTGLGLSYKPLSPAISPSPYLLGAVGYLHRRDAAGGKGGGLYLGGGAGISVGRHWLQGRYQVARVHGAPLGFLLIAAGTSF
jgi:hypothetical protein